jgi:glycosyltransferase involved in cell wall biosynthesis
MRIGVMSTTGPWVGGAFQYESLMLETLGRLHGAGRHTFEYLFQFNAAGIGWLDSGQLSLKGLPVRLLNKVDGMRPLQEELAAPPEPGETTPIIAHILANQARATALDNVDWLFLTFPSEYGFLNKRPFVMPIHDLQHRLQPMFPEVSAGGEFQRREFLFANACRAATLILVDSEVGKEDVLACYGNVIEPDRIRVLSYFPVNAVQRVTDPARLALVRSRYNLPERFFFYPAQFWPHKNHVRIVDAIGAVCARTGVRIPVAFCGHYNNDPHRVRIFEAITRRKTELGIADCIHYLGFVPDEDMAALYSLAAGLVMPTFFGPTNIPILEAWMCGCPTITSDIRGVREQAGDAALLVDPSSVDAIADALWRLWSDPTIARGLVERGTRRAQSYARGDYAEMVAEMVDDVCRRVAEGRVPPPLAIGGSS